MHADRATLTVDLGAIVANWRLLGARHGGAVAAVLKADAYGLGAARVGMALRDAGCRHFFVAQPAEGVALRAAIGPGPMIAVLNGCAADTAADASLTPVLNTLADCRLHAGRAAILHVDTGMARLGLDAAAQAHLAEDDALRRGLDLRYVMTHLACADAPDDPMNAAQAERFAQAAARLAPGIGRSVANSSGIFLDAGFRSDLARPGAALFGLNPTPHATNPMTRTVRLEAPILQLREIPAGATVGYGAAWRADRPSRIATVALGYADGFSRALSGIAGGHVQGHAVRLVGRVSMDLVTFDVTDAPAGPGEAVTLIGPDNPPDAVAALAGTIGYELLAGLGPRIRRDYVNA